MPVVSRQTRSPRNRPRTSHLGVSLPNAGGGVSAQLAPVQPSFQGLSPSEWDWGPRPWSVPRNSVRGPSSVRMGHIVSSRPLMYCPRPRMPIARKPSHAVFRRDVVDQTDSAASPAWLPGGCPHPCAQLPRRVRAGAARRQAPARFSAVDEVLSSRISPKRQLSFSFGSPGIACQAVCLDGALCWPSLRPGCMVSVPLHHPATRKMVVENRSERTVWRPFCRMLRAGLGAPVTFVRRPHAA